MTRHPAARLSLHGAIAAGWTVLAAVGVAAIASDPAAASPVQAATVLAADTSPVAAPLVTSRATQAASSTPVAGARTASTVTTAAPADRAVVALRSALAQIGLPYVWGGNGPSHGDAGFDCSGLTQFAYASAGIALPRTAHTQFYAGPHVPAGAALQPGDLVFYGTPSFVHHVGLYLGQGRMVNAPTFGEPVQVAYYRWLGDDYVGATRPDPTSIVNLNALPFIPQPAAPSPAPRLGGSDIFVAPRAPQPAPLPVPVIGGIAVPEAQSAAAAISEEREVGAAPLAATIPAPTGRTQTTAGSAPTSSAPAGAVLGSVLGSVPIASAVATPPTPSVAVPATTTAQAAATTTVAAAVTTTDAPVAPAAPVAPVVAPAPDAPAPGAAPAPAAPAAPVAAPAPAPRRRPRHQWRRPARTHCTKARPRPRRRSPPPRRRPPHPRRHPW